MTEDNTKLNILNAATELFAEKGFKGTTVRDICKKANTYQISINYYFGSKDNLYKESLIHAYHYSDEYLAVENLKTCDMEPFKKLRVLLKKRFMSLASLSDPKKNEFFTILTKSYETQGCMLKDEVLEKTVKVFMAHVYELISEVLGKDTDKFEINYAVFSLIGNFMAFSSPHYNLKEKLLFQKEKISEDDIDKLVDLIIKKLTITAIDKNKLEVE